MEKKILFLIKVNIITYLNNLLYTIITSKRELDGPIVFWALSPLLFLSITSFILAFDANPEYKIFKTEAIIDYIIRLIGCGIGFLNYKIEFMSRLFMIKIIIIFGLFLFNILLEIRIYNKVKITFTKEEYDVKEHINITPELKKNIRNMAYAVTL